MKIVFGVFLSFVFLAAGTARSEVLSVADVSNDYRLYITAWHADIEVVPVSINTITVNYSCERGSGEQPGADESGLRVVSSEGSLPELRKSDDKVTVHVAEQAGQCRMTIAAPPALETLVRINQTGSLDIQDWLGALTAWSAGGDVSLSRQLGAFSVTAMNGNASIEFVGRSLDADSAATAANGLVTLSLPNEPALTVRAQARWGEVLTDLDASFTRETDDQSSWSVARLGGGGAVVTLRNLNSDIVITRNAVAD